MSEKKKHIRLFKFKFLFTQRFSKKSYKDFYAILNRIIFNFHLKKKKFARYTLIINECLLMEKK